MNIYKRIITISLCLAFMLLIGGELLLSPFAIKAEAASSYSNVLDDLSKDPNFDPNSYPVNESDYSLQVIQIAEGANGELFIYVYQPSGASADLRALFITMDLHGPVEKNPKFERYFLSYVNSDGVFYKYVVNNFTVSKDEERFYSISMISRQFMDGENPYHDAIDLVFFNSFIVGQYWCAYDQNNDIVYEMGTLDVVEIDIKATGSVRYENGLHLGQLYFTSCDSHYIAFSIGNYKVEEIIDAMITYVLEDHRESIIYSPYQRIDEILEVSEPITKKLTNRDYTSNYATGLFGKNYTWHRIQKGEVFKNAVENAQNETFTQEERDAISDSDFVFCFDETEYVYNTLATGIFDNYTIAKEIGVLRLKFLSEGVTYNLGCVSDFVGTDSKPDANVTIGDNIQNTLEELSDGDWWNKIMMLLGIIILLLVLSFFKGPIKLVLDTVWIGVKYMFKCIFTIVSAPVRMIISYLKKK